MKTKNTRQTSNVIGAQRSKFPTRLAVESLGGTVRNPYKGGISGGRASGLHIKNDSRSRQVDVENPLQSCARQIIHTGGSLCKETKEYTSDEETNQAETKFIIPRLRISAFLTWNRFRDLGILVFGLIIGFGLAKTMSW